jgi:purine-binding chemotaxis protein CheW
VVVETQLRGQTIVVGVVADAVSEVVALPAEQIEPPPPFGTNVHVDFLVGMGKLDGRLVLVLDIDRILSPVELRETIEAAESAEPAILETA